MEVQFHLPPNYLYLNSSLLATCVGLNSGARLAWLLRAPGKPVDFLHGAVKAEPHDKNIGYRLVSKLNITVSRDHNNAQLVCETFTAATNKVLRVFTLVSVELSPEDEISVLQFSTTLRSCPQRMRSRCYSSRLHCGAVPRG
ncbi:hypothetical protein RRG08_013805 [Elysia crispata]|uniref:CD80-like immunoglobulin C2-set domain-containing protein n=1 Tax=Elysia crispata TaxID=231223 RepID=A0AAE1EDS5_9GAST|nr:hypothetical protein RRG08_013805 [Elysia crispata]